MDVRGHSSLFDARHFRRVRDAHVLLCGQDSACTEVRSMLHANGITVRHHPAPGSDHWAFDAHECDSAILRMKGADTKPLAQFARACRDDGISFCVILERETPALRLRAFTEGASDVISARWHPREIAARLVRILAHEVHVTHARCLHATLRKRMSDKSRQLDRTRLEMVNRLGRAAEYRDNETGQHVVRVGRFCEIIGRHLKLPTRRVALLRHASPLHDIGKIGVSDAILLKAGPLSPEEWEIMKHHTIIGAEILAGTDDALLETARTIALTHHERWDGGGYPAGLAGEDIPLCGRITAICDVYDALTSERPYKTNWSHREALAYLKHGRGSQFDPQVVDAFVTCLPEIREVKNHHRESSAPTNVYFGSINAASAQAGDFEGIPAL